MQELFFVNNRLSGATRPNYLESADLKRHQLYNITHRFQYKYNNQGQSFERLMLEKTRYIKV